VIKPLRDLGMLVLAAVAVLVSLLCASASAQTTDSSQVFPIPKISKPGYLNPITDPTFGTEVTRIAGNAGTPIDAVDGRWGREARHHYSKDQPWSSDESLIALVNGGTPSDVYLDGDSYEPVDVGCSGFEDTGYGRWNPSADHPDERILPHPGGDLIEWFDVVSCTQTRTFDLPFSFASGAKGPSGGPFSEGNPTPDGRFAAFAKNRNHVFVIDMDPQPPDAPYPAFRVGPRFDISNCGLRRCKLDWVSISPSGTHVVVSYDGNADRVLDVDPDTLALTPHELPDSADYPGCSGSPKKGFVYELGHADLAANPLDGDSDVLIGQEHCDNHGRTIRGTKFGYVVMARLDDGAVTSLTTPKNEAYPHHISTRNLDRPGWAYVSYYRCKGCRFSDEILAVKMDGSGEVERLAHSHTAHEACYPCEAHAVPSPDGQRVIWSSTWSKDCDDGCGSLSNRQAYVVDASP
jgi:hypothetical protein